MSVAHYVFGCDGIKRRVDAEEFQEAIDRELADHNDGVLPTTDEERAVIIEKMRKECK